MKSMNIGTWLLCIAAFVAFVTAQDASTTMVDRSMDMDYFRQVIVDQHNSFRRNVDPPASNMKHITWCPDLEKIAIQRAQNCTVNSNVFGNYQTKLFTMIGENTRFADGFQRAEVALNTTVADWTSEGQNYDYDTNYCSSSSCSKYKQVTHATSYRIGCAYNYCEKVDGLNDNQAKHLVTCLYGEAGNLMYELPMGGIASFRPYTKGAPCSNCQEGSGCNDGLCVDPSESSMSPTAASYITDSYTDDMNTDDMTEDQLYNRDVKAWRYEFSRWRRGMTRWETEMDRYQENTKECPTN